MPVMGELNIWPFLQSLIGVAILWSLLLHTKRRMPKSSSHDKGSYSIRDVSVIVPARNEVDNLQRLLPSLQRGVGAELDVLVVDDNSTDSTSEVARALGAQVILAGERPHGWTGKSWACHVGARATHRKVLLFIDADTIQDPQAIEALLPRLDSASLVSAAPYHLNPSWWEKLLGPFQILVLLSCAWDGGSRYAIGQFLMFRRDAYEKLGGHERVRETICEDLEFATRVREAHSNRDLDHGLWADLSGQIYKVRMYDSFSKFWSGWRRLMRLGLKRSKIWDGLAIYFSIAALCMGFQSASVPTAVMVFAFIGWVICWRLQRRWGEFSALGILAFPATLLLFVALTVVAIADQILRRDFEWRGRSYSWEAR